MNSLAQALTPRRWWPSAIAAVILASAAGDGFSASIFAASDETSAVESAPQESGTVDESVNGAENPAAPENPFMSMIDDEWMQRWKWLSSAPDVPLNMVWKLVRESDDAEPILVCSGTPKGFLYTTEVWSDFEMQLEWRFPKDADGNSGVLVFVQDESRVWPTSIQVQLHQPKAGSVFPSGDAKSDNTTDADLARPVGEWNECRIVCQSGRISVEVNGKKAGELTGATPSMGKVALQSEGSQVQFRRLKIRSLTDPKDKPQPDAPEPITSGSVPPGSRDSLLQ